MLAIINRDTLQLEAMVRAVPQQYSNDPFVAIPVEEYDPQAAFDKLHFTLLELQILYRNISGEHLRKISSFRGNVASAIQVVLRYGKPIASSTATLFEAPPNAQQLPTALPKHSHGVTTPPAKPKRPSGLPSACPAPGSTGARVWEALDKLKPTDSKFIKALSAELEINENTVRGNYGRWKIYQAEKLVANA